MAEDYLVNDLDVIAELEAEAAEIHAVEQEISEPYRDEKPTRNSKGSRGWQQADERRRLFLDRLARTDGRMGIRELCADIGISYYTYVSWRQRIPKFAAKVDEIRFTRQTNADTGWDGTRGSFHAKFFGHHPAWFQLMVIKELLTMPRGNILLVLFPPEHGKTTTFEDHANAQLALDPSWRFLVASESQAIAKKILGRVMDRMSPMGPTPAYVERFGPFEPQLGQGKLRVPWSDVRFRVYKARHSDERDYSMLAVGAGSKNIVSTRTDHAHCDDLQSVNTLAKTPKITEWFRQDLLSRPGETGITSVFGTRVGDGDVYEGLLEDEQLDSSIMKVMRLPAIITDNATGEVRPLWPQKWSLEQLDRQRRKVGVDAWDRNYMQAPGLSTKGRGTFNREMVEKCHDPALSLLDIPAAGSVIYAGLDPAIDSRNAVLLAQPTPDYRLIVRAIREDTDLKNNAQVIGALHERIRHIGQHGAICTDVVIEAMAFQKGLIHDENLIELRDAIGFNVRDHLTGWNKYDANIGIPSMVESFRRREIVLPWAPDDYTRQQIGELERQLYAWKPMVRGNRLRQDMVMALWFVWIIWRERWKRPSEPVPGNQSGFARAGLPWTPTKTGLLVPSR